MTQKTAAGETGGDFPVPANGRLDALLGRIDLIAILATLIGVFLVGVTGLVVAMIEIAKLVAVLWADPVERWLVIVVGLAVLWLIARGKRLCVF